MGFSFLFMEFCFSGLSSEGESMSQCILPKKDCRAHKGSWVWVYFLHGQGIGHQDRGGGCLNVKSKCYGGMG